MWESFDASTRQVVYYSQEEAGRGGQRYVNTEHLLLGLLRQKDCVAVRLLKKIGVSIEALRQDIKARVMPQGTSGSQQIELTPRAKRVLDLTREEARRFECRQVGTEHLLLGLLRERDGLAGRMLAKHQVTLEQLRHEVGMVPPNATLLRAAMEPQPSSDTLLRPADPTNQSRPDELLRPTLGVEEPGSKVQPEVEQKRSWLSRFRRR